MKNKLATMTFKIAHQDVNMSTNNKDYKKLIAKCPDCKNEVKRTDSKRNFKCEKCDSCFFVVGTIATIEAYNTVKITWGNSEKKR